MFGIDIYLFLLKKVSNKKIAEFVNVRYREKST